MLRLYAQLAQVQVQPHEFLRLRHRCCLRKFCVNSVLKINSELYPDNFAGLQGFVIGTEFTILMFCKGQLILKVNMYYSFHLNQKPTKIFFYFCPGDIVLSWVRAPLEVIFFSFSICLFQLPGDTNIRLDH